MMPEAIVDHQQQRALEFVWSDGNCARLEYQALRRLCPCAGCRSGRLVEGDGAAVAVNALLPVGTYGVQIVFSDGHDRGIFPWPYLREQAGLLLNI